MTKTERWGAAWAGFAATLCALTTVHPETESDTFWHMSLGRAVLAAHARVVHEPTALAAFTRPAVVPEWLWGVVTYVLFRAGGWPLLAVLLACLAFAATILVWRLTDAAGPSTLGIRCCVSGVVAACAMGRMRLRPEAAATPLLAGALLLTLRYLQAPPERRVRFAFALVGLTFLWAQVHGSFILAPVIFFILVSPTTLREKQPRVRQVHVATFGGLVLSLTSTAYGLDFLAYLAEHAGGDATGHVADMIPASFWAFNPSGVALSPAGPILLVMWGVGLVGMLVAREVWGSAAALALLGAALGFQAKRFLPTAPLFALPLAVRGANALRAAVTSPACVASRVARLLPVAGAIVGTATILLVGRVVHLIFGPLGHIGPADGVHPLAAAAYLRRLPAGAAVLTTYNAGGSLGFLLEGHVRTYVDGRTPLYFDDTDFGVSRDVFAYPGALARAAARYDARAILVNRDSAVCAKLPPAFRPVVVESHITTFAKDAAESLTGILPCGPVYIAPAACKQDAALGAEIDRMAALHDGAFVSYLRAERILQCGGPLDDARRLLPSRGASRRFLEQRDAAEAVILLRLGEIQRAVRVASVSADDGFLAATSVVAPVLGSGVIPPPVARDLLEPVITRLDDLAPPDLRAVLASVCAAQGDVRCARFHATRAAARGARGALPVLAWLRERAPTAEQRDDAAAWLETLRRGVVEDETTAPDAGARPAERPAREGDAPVNPP